MVEWIKEHKLATAGIAVIAILVLLFIRARLSGAGATQQAVSDANQQPSFIPTGFSGISLGTPIGGSIATYGSNGAAAPGFSNGATTKTTPAAPATGTVTVTGTNLATSGAPPSTSPANIGAGGNPVVTGTGASNIAAAIGNIIPFPVTTPVAAPPPATTPTGGTVIYTGGGGGVNISGRTTTKAV